MGVDYNSDIHFGFLDPKVSQEIASMTGLVDNLISEDWPDSWMKPNWEELVNDDGLTEEGRKSKELREKLTSLGVSYRKAWCDSYGTGAEIPDMLIYDGFDDGVSWRHSGIAKIRIPNDTEIAKAKNQLFEACKILGIAWEDPEWWQTIYIC